MQFPTSSRVSAETSMDSAETSKPSRRGQHPNSRAALALNQQKLQADRQTQRDMMQEREQARERLRAQYQSDMIGTPDTHQQVFKTEVKQENQVPISITGGVPIQYIAPDITAIKSSTRRARTEPGQEMLPTGLEVPPPPPSRPPPPVRPPTPPRRPPTRKSRKYEDYSDSYSDYDSYSDSEDSYDDYHGRRERIPRHRSTRRDYRRERRDEERYVRSRRYARELMATAPAPTQVPSVTRSTTTYAPQPPIHVPPPPVPGLFGVAPQGPAPNIFAPTAGLEPAQRAAVDYARSIAQRTLLNSFPTMKYENAPKFMPGR